MSEYLLSASLVPLKNAFKICRVCRWNSDSVMCFADYLLTTGNNNYLHSLSALLEHNGYSREKRFWYVFFRIQSILKLKSVFFFCKITLFIFYQQQPSRYILPVSKCTDKVRETKKFTCIFFSDSLTFSF